MIVGIVAIVGSFVFAAPLEGEEKATGNVLDSISEAELQKKIDEVVDRVMEEKIEATEAKIDKIMNEKIMTVGEYSDNVISDIDKNHDEVMFLYGMLNDKEKDVKKALIDVENLKRSIQNSESSPEAASGQPQDKNSSGSGSTSGEETPAQEMEAFYNNGEKQQSSSSKRNHDRRKKNAKNKKNVVPDTGMEKEPYVKNSGVALSAREVREKSGNNEKILELYRKGKEPMQIAKELKLGMGEVRLVIDLYKNR